MLFSFTRGNYFEGKFHHRNDVPERLPKLFWNPFKVSALQHVSLHDQIGGGWGGGGFKSVDPRAQKILLSSLSPIRFACLLYILFFNVFSCRFFKQKADANITKGK